MKVQLHWFNIFDHPFCILEPPCPAQGGDKFLARKLGAKIFDRLGPLLLAIPVGDSILFRSHSFFFFLFSSFFSRHDFVRAISLEPSLVQTPNWVCCLVLRSNFALLLTIQFTSLISSLINIISLRVTSFNSAVTLKLKCGKVVCVEFFIFGGSLLGRIQGDREPVSFWFTRMATPCSEKVDIQLLYYLSKSK